MIDNTVCRVESEMRDKIDNEIWHLLEIAFKTWKLVLTGKIIMPSLISF